MTEVESGKEENSNEKTLKGYILREFDSESDPQVPIPRLMPVNGNDFFLYNFCWRKLGNEAMLLKDEKHDYRGKVHDFVQHLLDEGKEFERKVIALLETKGDLVVISGKSEAHRLENTIKAMREGAKLIYHGTIMDDTRGLSGVPDLLVRSDDAPSKYGEYHYQPIDIKSSHDPQGEQILQVILYKEILKNMQLIEPTNAYIYNQSREGEEIYDIYAFEHNDSDKLNADIDKYKKLQKKAENDIKDINKLIADVKSTYKIKAPSYYEKRIDYKKKMFEAEKRESKYSAIVGELKNRIKIVEKSDELEAKFDATLEDIRAIKAGVKTVTPTITSECKMCDYNKACYKLAETSRDISLVAGTGRVAKRNLEENNVKTIEQLLEVEDITSLVAYRFTEKMIRGLITNALGWKENRMLTHLDNKLIEEYGGALLEKPKLRKSKVGIQIDFEADEGTGNMVMIGINVREGKKQYGETFFAETPDDELKMLTEFMKFIQKVDDDVQLYHWSAYEKTHFKNMFDRHYPALFKEFGNKYFDIEDKILDNLVDLYPMTMASISGPIHGYSLKTVLPKLFGFEWSEDSDIGKLDGAKFEVLYTKLQNLPPGEEKDKIRNALFQYNQDDVTGPWLIKDKLYELSRIKA